jgi:hypothetical protein
MSADRAECGPCARCAHPFRQQCAGVAVAPEAMWDVDRIEAFEELRGARVLRGVSQRLLHQLQGRRRLARVVEALGDLAGSRDGGASGSGSHAHSGLQRGTARCGDW